jgi:uncharacterized protein DUF3866
VSDPRPQRLVLRRGVVASVDREGPATEITVDVNGERRRATSYAELTGPVAAGDEVVVNTAAVDLGLGSGGFDLVHANLTRGLAGAGEPGAHVMKLNYTSLQHAVQPLEERAPEVALPLDRPVAVCFLHAQLPCVAWAAHERAPEARLGYVQGAGGALPGALSRTVADLREGGLLAGHVTAGSAFGGEHDAITVAGALNAGFTELEWDGAIVAPGPGIVGSATALGHGGLAALDAAHAALALGCETLIVPRMSSGDPRERHRGLSHHSKTVLELLLRPALVALPQRAAVGLPGEHEPRPGRADIEGYAASGLPATTMGRSIDEDQLFFGAALAGGSVLGELLATG